MLRCFPTVIGMHHIAVMKGATLMMRVAPLWWGPQQPLMQSVDNAIERALSDRHTRALLPMVDGDAKAPSNATHDRRAGVTCLAYRPHAR
jgi:hypothetical protein